MAGDADMGGWTELLHSSSKLLEQAAPSSHFPPLQRNLDQLEALSKKLKAKTLRAEAPTQSIAATRLLAREGINAEQLTRDLKSFELKTTVEDVFPSEVTTVEEYLQQVHEMAMISAIQEAQKDNLRSFDDYMMHVLEEDWQKEKRDFLHSLSRLSSLPRSSNVSVTTGISHAAQMMPSKAPRDLTDRSSVDVPLINRPISERKALMYAEEIKKLNESRERGLPFNPATSFCIAHDIVGFNISGAKSVSMQKIWHLIQALVGETSAPRKSASKKMSLVIGARQHLEWGHEKYILDTIQSHPAQASLGGAVGNLQKIRAFLRVRLRDHGMLDFDSNAARRQPPVDTTWQQIYFSLRTGYYDEALTVAQSSRVASQFAHQLAEWISSGGMVSHDTAVIASEECEKMLRLGDRAGRTGYDKKKLLLYAILSGCRRQIDRLLREFPTLFSTIEDFLWFKLASVRDYPNSASSIVLNEGFVPYSLEDLQRYLNKFEPSHYTKNGKDPLVYPYVLLLSIQLLPAILHLSKEIGDAAYNVDAVHIAVTLSDHGVLSEGAAPGHKLTVMDIYSEVTSIIRQYGTFYLHHGNLLSALEYYAQAAATMGGGRLSWTSHGNADQRRQRNMMLNQLLTEILLCDGGIPLLLGPRGTGEEGSLRRFITERNSQQQFLLEAANQCLGAGLYDKSIEIHKRVGSFAMALETINKCLSDAICAFARGKLDGESRTTSLIQSGNAIIEFYKNTFDARYQERGPVSDQQTILRQLEAILNIHKLSKLGKYVDSLREITKLSFLPLDPHAPDTVQEVFQHLSPHVQACVPDLLKLALNSLDNVRDVDSTLRNLKFKISNFVANNMTRSWPNDLYERIAQSL